MIPRPSADPCVPQKLALRLGLPYAGWGKFLLHHGKRPTDAGPSGTQKYVNWIRIHARFEQPAFERHGDALEEIDHIADLLVMR